MLAGLTSRWTMCRSWAWWSASATRRREAQGLPPIDATVALDARGEGLALQVLEGDVQAVAAGVAAHVVDDDDAGMVEPGGDARLVEEALLEPRAVLVGHGQEQAHRLQGDGPAQRRIEGAIHDAHHPAADLFLDLVAPQDPGAGVSHDSPRTMRPRSAHDTRGQLVRYKAWRLAVTVARGGHGSHPLVRRFLPSSRSASGGGHPALRKPPPTRSSS